MNNQKDESTNPYADIPLSDQDINRMVMELREIAKIYRAFSADLTGKALDYGIDAGYKL